MPERYFVSGHSELGADRIRHFPRHEIEGDGERIADPDAAHDDIDRVGKLLGEASDAPAANSAEIEEQQRQRRCRRQSKRDNAELDDQTKEQEKYRGKPNRGQQEHLALDPQAGLGDQIAYAHQRRESIVDHSPFTPPRIKSLGGI